MDLDLFKIYCAISTGAAQESKDLTDAIRGAEP
jgi:hypothetical protein